MAQLADLPKELLDMIADEIDIDTETDRPYQNLNSLSLTSQRLRTTAQEAMHRDIVLQLSDYEDLGNDSDDPHATGWRLIGCLVYTLLQRPNLACMVRKLKVSITERTIGHKLRCKVQMKDRNEGACICCDWDNIARLCANFLKTTSFSTGPGFNNARWLSLIRVGEQLAVLGIILACTPKLQTLAIDRWSGYYQADWSYDPEPIPKSLSFRRMFGTVNRANGFSIFWILGLANLRSFSTNCLIPQQLVALPQVSHLKFGLQDRHVSWVPDAIRRSQPLSADSGAEALKRLSITVDVKCLSEGVRSKNSHIYNYTPHLVQCLPNLIHLDLIVSSERCEQMRPGSFDLLTKKFQIHNIETLKIDTSDISRHEVPIYGDYDHDGWTWGDFTRWAVQLGSIKDLSRFTKLRKIVVAQRAFFSVDEAFTVCELPTAIEEIGIIETTSAVERWLKHMLHNKWKYLNLKTITFWVQNPYDFHFKHDVRLGDVNDYPSEDEDSEDEKTTGAGSDNEEVDETDIPPLWKQEFVNASRDYNLWTELEDAGVDLREKYLSHTRYGTRLHGLIFELWRFTVLLLQMLSVSSREHDVCYTGKSAGSME